MDSLGTRKRVVNECNGDFATVTLHKLDVATGKTADPFQNPILT